MVKCVKLNDFVAQEDYQILMLSVLGVVFTVYTPVSGIVWPEAEMGIPACLLVLCMQTIAILLSQPFLHEAIRRVVVLIH